MLKMLQGTVPHKELVLGVVALELLREFVVAVVLEVL